MHEVTSEGVEGYGYKRVEQHFDEDRETRMEGFTSLAHYINIKWWGATDESRAVFSGEVGKRGPSPAKDTWTTPKSAWMPFEDPLQSRLPTCWAIQFTSVNKTVFF